jgi:hypothetical protein
MSGVTFKDAVDSLMPFVKKITGKTEDKAIRDVARAVAVALFETDTDVTSYFNDYKQNKIFNPDCLFLNIDDMKPYITAKYADFCRVLFQLRPVGLGTPNAACGEGELMCLFGSPRVGISKVKDSGDLTVDNKKVELKGYEFRLFGTVTGKALQTEAKILAKKYNVKPNVVNGAREAYEPWDAGDKKSIHWIGEFRRIGEDAAKNFLYEVLSHTSKSFNLTDFDSCFVNNKFSPSKLQQVIIKTFFKDMEKKWDSFTVLSDNSIRAITPNESTFNSMVDSGKIYVSENYFRSFQDVKVGLYVKLA